HLRHRAGRERGGRALRRLRAPLPRRAGDPLMATYVARVGTVDGSVGVRTIEAPDESTARNEVTRQGGHVFSIRSSKEAARGRTRGLTSFLPGRRGIKLHEFIVFNQELVALLRAGLPIVSGF